MAEIRLTPGEQAIIKHDGVDIVIKHFEGNGEPPPMPGALYGGEFGPWNLPVIGMADHPNSARIVNRWYEITSAGINVNSAKWCPRLVDLETATEEVHCIAEKPECRNRRGAQDAQL